MHAPAPELSSEVHVAGIIIAAIGGFVLLTIVVMLLVRWRQRRQIKLSTKPEQGVPVSINPPQQWNNGDMV